jgi:IclR family pca regulon transcriptional regulator
VPTPASAGPVDPAPGAAPARTGDPDYMLSLARGLSVIRAFGEVRSMLTVADVARATGLSRAAARRCLHTLSVLGYVTATSGRYELTPAILSLGYAYLHSTMIARAAQPVLERVSDELHESSSLAVLDGDEIVYVARAATRRILSISLSVGSRLPAGCTSMGRVLLAYADSTTRASYLSRVRLKRYTEYTLTDRTTLAAELERVRAQGFAIVDQELEMGLRAFAVPVRRQDGAVVAALNVGVHAARADAKTLQRDFLPILRRAAATIARSLEGVRT